MVECSRCGIEIDDSFNQCPNCGNDLKAPDDNAPNDGTCSNCGFEIDGDVEFCPNCGSKLGSLQTLRCSECGSQINEDDLICSVCGAKIDWPTLCPNCKSPIGENAEFCDKCGQNLNLGKKDLVASFEENLDNISQDASSIFDRIILFFKQLFGRNS